MWCEAIRIPAFFIFKKGAGFQLLIISCSSLSGKGGFFRFRSKLPASEKRAPENMEVKSEGSNEFQIYENCFGIPLLEGYLRQKDSTKGYWQEIATFQRYPKQIWMARAVVQLSAPFCFPTLPCKIHYRKKANFAGQCRFCREKSRDFRIENTTSVFFSLLHKNLTAILVNIRAPPSEI